MGMLKQKIQSDATDSLKQGNHEITSVLRMTISVINAKEKEKRYKILKEDSEVKEEELLQASQLTDDEIIGVVSSEIKKRKDAIVLYQQGNRPELAQKEKEEISILQKYLPEPLSEDELKKLIQESINNVGAKEIKDMGKIMSDLVLKVRGRADNSHISGIIKKLLD